MSFASPFEPFRHGPMQHVQNHRATHRNRYATLLDPEATAAARVEIASWPGYVPTPLHELSGLAGALGVAALYYKDEGERFGLRSFKALGGAYGVLHVLRREVAARVGRDVPIASVRSGVHANIASAITVVTATDGNHGRSVAWGARQFGCRAKIYMHAHVSEARADAVRSYGAEVVRVDGDYDQAVARAAEDAEREGWHVVADTGYGAYREIPSQVMAGYTVTVAEALDQLASAPPPSHVFVPGGVGGLAGAVCSHLRYALPERPVRFVVVEPSRAPCLFESARCGERTVVPVVEETVMAGLSCGAPSELAWPMLAAEADHFTTIPDEWVAPAMRLLVEAPLGDPSIVAGESAVAGLCALLNAAQDPALADALELDRSSRVLLLGTEGATDPEIYRRMTGVDPSRLESVTGA